MVRYQTLTGPAQDGISAHPYPPRHHTLTNGIARIRGRLTGQTSAIIGEDNGSGEARGEQETKEKKKNEKEECPRKERTSVMNWKKCGLHPRPHYAPDARMSSARPRHAVPPLISSSTST